MKGRWYGMLPSRIFLDDFLDDLTPSKENNKMICDIYEEDGKWYLERRQKNGMLLRQN